MTDKPSTSLLERVRNNPPPPPPKQVVFDLPTKEISIGIIAFSTVVFFVALGFFFATTMSTETLAVTLDTDGDGVIDKEDRFPGDVQEWLDTDFDGIGNNADLDDDGDGYSDHNEEVR